MDCLCKTCMANCLLAMCQSEDCNTSCFSYIIKECHNYEEVKE